MKTQRFIIILFSLLYFSCEERNHTENLLHQIDELKSKNDSLERKISRIENQDKTGTIQDISSNYWFNSNFEALEFKQYGIKNPAEYIENQLRKSPGLIPLQGVLGGRMQFGKIQILGNKWVIAEYEDGHIYGKSIFLYKFKNGREIEFKLLDSINP